MPVSRMSQKGQNRKPKKSEANFRSAYRKRSSPEQMVLRAGPLASTPPALVPPDLNACPSNFWRRRDLPIQKTPCGVVGNRSR